MSSISFFFFFGFLLVLGIISYLIWESERRKERIGDLTLRLERMVKGDDKLRMRHLRRLNLSAFLHDRVLRELDGEVADLERDSGLEPVPRGRRLLVLHQRRIDHLDERLARLEQARGAQAVR